MALTRPALAVLALALIAAQPAQGAAAPTAPKIVVYRAGVVDAPAQTRKRERALSFAASQRFSRVIKGFAARLTERQVANLRSDPQVAAVVPDRPVHIDSQPLAPGDSVPTGVARVGAAVGDQVRAASGVGVAVIDTGIDLGNADLNVVPGTNCVDSGAPPQDDNGHGTHVAGTIGALNNGSGVVGVAPGTTLYAVKVLGANGSGTASTVICGLDWVYANAEKLGIKVVNMSLGSTGSPGSCVTDPERAAICRLVGSGVNVVAAAGNEGAGISETSRSHLPAAYPEVLAVTAMADTNGEPGGGGAACAGDSDDTPASFSNWAATAADQAHTVAGPGACITSTKLGGGLQVMSGTSMAAPHVTGSVALCIDEAGSPGPCAGETPAEVITTIREAAARAGALGLGFLGDPLQPLGRYFGFLAPASAGASATTSAADGIGDEVATLHGAVSSGGRPVKWWFEYGSGDGTYEYETPRTDVTPASDPLALVTDVTALDPGTTYHFRMVVQAGPWYAYGPDQSFTTTGTAPPPPPDTSIVSGPALVTADPTVSIGFSASPAADASGFECRLDSLTWSSCVSPYSAPDVGEGPHSFYVRSLALNGKPEATPAAISWKVDRTPPETLITGHPTDPTTNRSASFGIAINESATLECRLDGAPWSACDPVISLTGLALGRHQFEARATDTVGLVDASPATFAWTVVATAATPPAVEPTPPADPMGGGTEPNPLTPVLGPQPQPATGRLTVASAPRLDGRGRLALRLRCGTAAPCRGTLELRAAGRRIARSAVAMVAGASATRSLILDPKIRRKLARGRVVISFRLVGSAGTNLAAQPTRLLTQLANHD